MANQTKYAGIVTQASSGGTLVWNTPNRAAGDNLTTYAEVGTFEYAAHQSQYLVAENYGFTIPSGSAINGIQVEIIGGYETTAGFDQAGQVSVVDYSLSIGGKSISPPLNSYSPLPVTSNVYGGPSEKFGYTWTAAEINSSNFGIIFDVVVTNPLFDMLNPLPQVNTNLRVYAIAITVEYGDAEDSGIDPYPTYIQEWYTVQDIGSFDTLQEWFTEARDGVYPKLAFGALVDNEPTVEDRLYHLIESRSMPYQKADVELTTERRVRVELEDDTR